MKIYINGTGIVSPQKTWDNTKFLEEVKEYHARMLTCVEPEMDPGLDDKYLRRMSRLIRLGWMAAKICLDDAGSPRPDAIITGSGWGSLQDSEKFLLSIYRNKENLLPPTPFIQSTHNAVGAQIALLTNNSAYNMTYAHGSQAFEHALQDAILQLQHKENKDILLGGFDEITPNQFILNDRLHRWRKEPVNNLQLFHPKSHGTIAGEGFNFFFLQDHPSDNTYAEIKDVMTIFSEDEPELIAADALAFLGNNGLGPDRVDWVFSGINGDTGNDEVYHKVLSGMFPQGFRQAAWKHLCGEYHTSTAFATWAAAKSLKCRSVPAILRSTSGGNHDKLRNILIYNHFKGAHHSFILVSAPE